MTFVTEKALIDIAKKNLTLITIGAETVYSGSFGFPHWLFFFLKDKRNRKREYGSKPPF